MFMGGVVVRLILASLEEARNGLGPPSGPRGSGHGIEGLVMMGGRPHCRGWMIDGASLDLPIQGGFRW